MWIPDDGDQDSETMSNQDYEVMPITIPTRGRSQIATASEW
jgi:hypothetical protein